MFDTVRIIVSNILSTNRGLRRAIVNWGEGKTIYDASGVRGVLRREVIMRGDGQIREKLGIKSKEMPSSNYNITAFISVPNDNIILEFSLPKYYYGNNILQICDSPLDIRFDRGFGVRDTLEFQFKHIYPKLVTHIKNFFYGEFAGVKIDYSAVSIGRVDLCFNQIFRSKEDTLQYLEEQKSYAKKSIKAVQPYNYATSVFIVTKNYTFKIYHKGAEFQKTDKPQIVRAAKGKELKLKAEQTASTLQNIADKILRYELSFRNGQMSYLYNSQLFRARSKDYEAKTKVYLAMHYLIQRNELSLEKMKDNNSALFKKINYFNRKVLPSRQMTFKNYLLRKYHRSKYEPSIIQMAKYYIRFHTDFDKQLNTQRTFLLKLPNDYGEEIIDDHESDTLDLETIKEKEFSADLLAVMSKQFIDVIKEYIPKRIDSTFSMTKLLTQHNLNIAYKKKSYKSLNMQSESSFMSPNLYKMIFLLMEKHSLRQIKELLKIPKTTYYRYRDNLKLLGISEDTILNPITIDVDLSYNRYYNLVEDNKYTFSKMVPIKILW